MDMPTAHLLIADQFNNRVIEIDRQGTIHWTFGDGSSSPGPHSVVGPNDAERLPNGDTLICGSGAPQGPDPTCKTSGGCQDNRVLIVDSSGAIKWQYGQNGGVSGRGPNQLNAPVCARLLPGGNVLIADQGNNRIIEVTPAKTIAWQYPANLDAGSPLANPNSAERLPNGDTLIADENNNRAVEVDHAGNVVWQYPAADAGTASQIGYVAFASRLPNGNTLITDGMDSRILEITAQLTVAWTYDTSKRPGSNVAPLASRALRLSNGNTLISDQFNHQVLEIDPGGNEVFSYGSINVAGKGPGQLDGPYDAKVIGDFTGLTAPR